jgi:bifunctional UDP-N-acetylglucosamine pyrophosphorylase/glucosamine-1-phosphate N-acetyltransferase
MKIGDRAYVGSGSVITKGVSDDAMAVGRSPQTNCEGGAARYREMKTRGKTPKSGRWQVSLRLRLNAVSIRNNY